MQNNSTMQVAGWGLVIICAGFLQSCDNKKDDAAPTLSNERSTHQTLFEMTDPEETGVRFTNYLREDEELNYHKYEYVYNGGGVAIGDVNNDGLMDIYFTANQAQDRLYLNRGNFNFEDITSATGIDSDGWNTGVTMADIDADGFLDIYVCRSGPSENPEKLRDLVFHNNGDNTFTEVGVQIGLNLGFHSTQAAFFDMENDGDLDLMVVGHHLRSKKPLDERERKKKAQAGEDSDHLFRNDAGVFTDITGSAGMLDYNSGLGLGLGDLNNDGYCDIYVSNDYDDSDALYMNNGDGTFTDRILTAMKHIPNFAMGVDIADVNNDGMPDVYTLDMAFETHKRSKMNMSSMSSARFWGRVNAGFHHQYMHNMFQINNGNGTFSEVAQAVGIHKTDWSWASLWFDMDLNGRKDLYVTNGYRREMKDRDAENKSRAVNSTTLELDTYLDLFPVNKLKNYAYAQTANLQFEKRTGEWGFGKPTHSNGAAYGDLDNDGDLDLVVNNLDETALIYRNTATANGDAHWLGVELKGNGQNVNGIGARVMIRTASGDQYAEVHATRGYHSSVDSRIIFGLGTEEMVEEMTVQWPTGEISRLVDIKVGKYHQVDQAQAGLLANPPSIAKEPQYFVEVEGAMGVDYVHSEQQFDDFYYELLLPHKQSQHGPFISVGDVDLNGYEDVFIGGAKGQPGMLYVQEADGKFTKRSSGVFANDKEHEDLGSVLFDADNDGDLDLYVCSGGVEHPENSIMYNDRLYLNSGNGEFTRSNKLPTTHSSTGVVHAQDIDGDGDIDLVVGGRNTPGRYPLRPRSIVLKNENGSFTDATDELAPDLKHIGMITSINSGDIDQDGDLDLVVAGEWMSITLFLNQDGKFEQSSNAGFQESEGWWYSSALQDIDGDGDLDLVAGNLGNNNKFHPDHDHPLHVYCNDFDASGSYDIVLAKYEGETCYPVRGKECSSQQMPMINERFPTYKAFANAELDQIYGAEGLNSALHLMARDMESGIFLNDGAGNFSKHGLPKEAQFAPLNALEFVDLDNDGDLDIVGGGNMYQVEVETTRYDAGTGVCLLNDGNGEFVTVPTSKSGLFIDGDVKDLKLIELAGKEKALIVTNNNGPVQLIKILPTKKGNGLAEHH